MFGFREALSPADLGQQMGKVSIRSAVVCNCCVWEKR
jgi:hypothetical protein